MFITSIYHRLTSSSLLKNSIIYVITDGINKAIPFLLLPLVSRFLTPEDYGIVTNFDVLIQVLSVFVYFAFAGIIPVMFFKTGKDEMKLYVSNMLLLETIITMFCLVIIIIGHSGIEKGSGLSLLFQIMAVITVWFSSITYVNLILWRCEEKPLKFGSFQITGTMINAFSTVLFVIIMLLGWRGRVYSLFLSSALMGVLGIWLLRKRGYCKFTFSKKHIYGILAFGLPLIPHALSFWFKSGSDKILLTNLCSLADNGLYSVALTWGSVVSLFLTAYNNSYSPWLFKKLSEFDSDKKGTMESQKRLVKIIWISLLITFIIVGIIYFISYGLTLLVYPANYFGSLEYLSMVMVSQAFTGGYLLFVCFCHYTLNTKTLGAITFSLSLLQVFASYIFIRVMGAVGVAYSSALISSLTFVLIAGYSMHIYKLPWFDFYKKQI